MLQVLLRWWCLTLGMALLGCVEERALFVPEVYEGQRARGALLAVEREGAQTLLALDLENDDGDPGLVEPYQEGDLTHLFLFTNTPSELFWPTGPLPLAVAQVWPVPTPLLAQYCGRVGDEGLSLGECDPSLILQPRLPLPDVMACLRTDRCVVGQGSEARCLPFEPSPVTAPTAPEAPRPRSGPCPAGWEATGPLALCRPTWTPVPNCATRYTAASGCLPSLPPCPTSTVALGPNDPWRAAIEDGPAGVVHLGPGVFTATGGLSLPPGRQVIGACGATTIALPMGAQVDRPGAPRRLENLIVAPTAPVVVVGGQILHLNNVDLRPSGPIFALEVRSATVALVDVHFVADLAGSLARGQGAAVRAQGLSAQGGGKIFELQAGSDLKMTNGVVVGPNQVLTGEDSHTSITDSHFSGFIEGGVVLSGGSLRLQGSEVIGAGQLAVLTSSSTIDLREVYVGTQGEGTDPLVFLPAGVGQVHTCELTARIGEGLVLGGGELQVSDLWISGGLNGVAAKGATLQANLQRVRVIDSLMAMTVNDGAEIELSDFYANTRCEGLSSISASRTELRRGELLLLEGGDGCDGPVLGVNLDRGAQFSAQDLRIVGAAKAVVSKGNDLKVPQLIVERIALLDNAVDLELNAGRVNLRGVGIEGCDRWASCTGLTVSSPGGRIAELEVENFSVRGRSSAFEVAGGELQIGDGTLESCPNYTTVTGLGLGPVPELLLERVRLLPCGAP
ncbi:MAG: hypothetical protein IPG45_26020 [Deltaproteobacteria bacterium]|nr:hypothetical protein [Deltaproteobacteria bacterium]